MDIPQRQKGGITPFPLSGELDAGTTTKKDFEMVIARYDENIQWSDSYAAYRTVYNKGESLADAIPLENKGHLAGTIFHHIIQNYDCLASCTFFCHGGINYRPDQQISVNEFYKFVSTNPKYLHYLKGFDLPKADGRFYNYSQTAKEVYEYLYEEKYKPTFPWAPGTWISVGRDRIRQKPIEFYEKIFAWIMSPYEGEEPSLTLYRTRDIYLERFILKAWL
jgi:hypothetical protein